MTTTKFSLVLLTVVVLAVLALAWFIVVVTGSTAGLTNLADLVRAIASLLPAGPRQ